MVGNLLLGTRPFVLPASEIDNTVAFSGGNDDLFI